MLQKIDSYSLSVHLLPCSFLRARLVSTHSPHMQTPRLRSPSEQLAHFQAAALLFRVCGLHSMGMVSLCPSISCAFSLLRTAFLKLALAWSNFWPRLRPQLLDTLPQDIDALQQQPRIRCWLQLSSRLLLLALLLRRPRLFPVARRADRMPAKLVHVLIVLCNSWLRARTACPFAVVGTCAARCTFPLWQRVPKMFRCLAVQGVVVLLRGHAAIVPISMITVLFRL